VYDTKKISNHIFFNFDSASFCLWRLQESGKRLEELVVVALQRGQLLQQPNGSDVSVFSHACAQAWVAIALRLSIVQHQHSCLFCDPTQSLLITDVRRSALAQQ
jgi:hypothetical protein